MQSSGSSVTVNNAKLEISIADVVIRGDFAPPNRKVEVRHSEIVSVRAAESWSKGLILPGDDVGWFLVILVTSSRTKYSRLASTSLVTSGSDPISKGSSNATREFGIIGPGRDRMYLLMLADCFSSKPQLITKIPSPAPVSSHAAKSISIRRRMSQPS